jgi:hypothetical protein
MAPANPPNTGKIEEMVIFDISASVSRDNVFEKQLNCSAAHLASVNQVILSIAVLSRRPDSSGRKPI